MSVFPIETGILEGAAQQAGRVHRVILKPNVTATVTPGASLPPGRAAPVVQEWLAAQGHGAHDADVAPSACKRGRAILDGRIYFQKITNVRVP